MSEHDIIRGCRQDEPHSQRALVERYAPMLLTVARRYAGDVHLAQDILQDALIKIFRAIPAYRPAGAFEAWMRRIVVNTALQALNKNRIWAETGCLEEIDGLPSAPPDVYTHLGAEELLCLISRLPDGFRQVFNLFVIEQCPHSEIAALLKITESTSRSQLARARRMLQKMIMNREKSVYER